MREFLACSDELSALKLVFTRKKDFFQRLREDCVRHDKEDEEAGIPINNPEGETSLERVDWVLHMVSEQYDDCERLLADLLSSMNAVSSGPALQALPPIMQQQLTDILFTALPTPLN